MDLSGLDSSLPAGLADAERDMTDKFRAAALSMTNLYKTSLGNTKQAYQVGYSAALADVLSKVQSDIGAGEDAAVALARLMDWTEARQTAMAAFAQDNDDEPPAAAAKPRTARPSSAPAQTMPRYTAPGPSALSQRADRPDRPEKAERERANGDQMEEDTPSRPMAPTPREPLAAASSPILSPARPQIKTLRSNTRVPTTQAPQGAFNFSVPIPVNVLPGMPAEEPAQVGPTGAKRPMLEPQGEPSTPRGRAAKRRSAVGLSEERQRNGRRRGPSPPSGLGS